MPKIVAVIAVKNSESTIQSAVTSLLVQSFNDFEVIVVDNNSTDSTVSIVRSLAEKDKRLSLQSCPDDGPFFCRNQAMRTIDSEFIAVMDGDDISVPHRFEQQVEFLDSRPNHVAVGSRIVLFGDAVGMPEMAYSERECRTYLSLFNPCCHPSLMIRKTALDKIGLYNESYKIAADYDLVRRLSYQGRIENLQQPLLLYRVHKNQISSQKKVDQRIAAYRILKEHHAHLLGVEEISNPRLIFEMSKMALQARMNLKRQSLYAIKSCLQTMMLEENV